MDPSEWSTFDKIRQEVQCEKGFCCVTTHVRELCRAELHADIDLLECLEANTTCKFARPFSMSAVCRCPMRKFIAENFDRWTEFQHSTENPPKNV